MIILATLHCPSIHRMMSWNGNAFCITGTLWSLVDCLHKGPVMQSFDVSLEVSLKKLLNKDLWDRWIKMSWWSFGHKIIKSCKKCLNYKPSLYDNIHTAMDTGVPPLETKYATEIHLQPLYKWRILYFPPPILIFMLLLLMTHQLAQFHHSVVPNGCQHRV